MVIYEAVCTDTMQYRYRNRQRCGRRYFPHHHVSALYETNGGSFANFIFLSFTYKWHRTIQILFFFFFFFLKFLADTCPFLGAMVPLFWISGDVSSGFQSQSGFCLICYFCRGKCNVHSPRFTSGATLANLLAAGVQPVTSPHACAEVGLGSD